MLGSGSPLGALGILQVETRSLLFAGRWRVTRSSTLVRDNTDLLPFPAHAEHRFSRWKLYSAAVGELNVPPNEWSAAFEYVFGANWKAHGQARGTAHCSASTDTSASPYTFQRAQFVTNHRYPRFSPVKLRP
jgi:hypothetical protein